MSMETAPQARCIGTVLQAPAHFALAACAALDATAASQAEQAGLLEARATQLRELQERLEAERQALRQREAVLTQAEQTREALQEQLRRRSEELAVRQKTQA